MSNVERIAGGLDDCMDQLATVTTDILAAAQLLEQAYRLLPASEDSGGPTRNDSTSIVGSLLRQHAELVDAASEAQEKLYKYAGDIGVRHLVREPYVQAYQPPQSVSIHEDHISPAHFAIPASIEAIDTPLDEEDRTVVRFENRYSVLAEVYTSQLLDCVTSEQILALPQCVGVGSHFAAFEITDPRTGENLILKVPKFDTAEDENQIRRYNIRESTVALKRLLGRQRSEQLVAASDNSPYAMGIVTKRAPGVAFDELTLEQREQIPSEDYQNALDELEFHQGKVHTDLYKGANLFYEAAGGVGFTFIDPMPHEMLDYASSAQTLSEKIVDFIDQQLLLSVPASSPWPRYAVRFWDVCRDRYEQEVMSAIEQNLRGKRYALPPK